MRGALACRSAHATYACHPCCLPPLPVQASVWPLPPGIQQAYSVHTLGELCLPLPCTSLLYIPKLHPVSLRNSLFCTVEEKRKCRSVRRQILPDAAEQQWQRRTVSQSTACALSPIFARKLVIARVSACAGAALLTSPVSRASSAALSAQKPSDGVTLPSAAGSHTRFHRICSCMHEDCACGGDSAMGQAPGSCRPSPARWLCSARSQHGSHWVGRPALVPGGLMRHLQAHAVSTHQHSMPNTCHFNNSGQVAASIHFGLLVLHLLSL